MPDFLKDITTAVATATGLTIGSMLYAGTVPEEGPDTAVLLRDSGGPDGWQRAFEGQVAQPMLQVLVRAPTHFQARDLAWQVHSVLHQAVGVQVGDHYIMVIEAVARPQGLGPDERKPPRHYYSTNYQCRMKQTA